MSSSTKLFKLAAAGLLASTVGASAATLDFTTDSLASTPTGFEGSFSFAGSPNTVTYTIDGSPTAAKPGDSVPLSAEDELDAADLAGDFDGIGIDDDEIGGVEIVTVTFSREVMLTGAFFLDLFISPLDPNNFETAGVTSEYGTQLFHAYNVNDGPAGNGGFGAFTTRLRGTVFSFFEESGNDDIGRGDYAIAGLTVAPVPLPAGVLLLGTALGGLGLARRRKKAAKA